MFALFSELTFSLVMFGFLLLCFVSLLPFLPPEIRTQWGTGSWEKLSGRNRRIAMWFLLNGSFIHITMDG
jgi:hypothetical protein